ncbi:hypothetical protein NKH71_30330 [Mesorhizobium sp. M0983]|uniref:hypothetical protein n=1 Tax=Mesorhizobium sp. M0983 TaxID=2957040 RepID=UPI003335F620
MSRRQRSRRRPGDASEIGKIITAAAILLVCVAIAVFLGYSYLSRPARVALSQESLCPEDGPHSKMIVLLDRSDNLPDITKSEIKTYLLDIADTTPKYGLLELRLLDPNIAGGAVVFSRCNPGDGSDLSAFDSNPKLAKNHWKQAFQDPLEAALKNLGGSPSDTSPIMETIQRIAVDQFSGRKAEEMPKNLTVISDMIEHVSDYSQYRGNLAFEEFARTPAYRRLRTDLHGAAVTVKYLVRLNTKIDSAKHIQFWRDWIAESHGSRLDADKLQGAG